MSTINSAYMMSNMQTDNFPWNKTVDAPAWNNWTEKAANPLDYNPGNYVSAPDYKMAFWQSAPQRSAYGGATPTYERLSQGDYKDYETALRTPGEIAAKEALASGQKNLNSTMANNGMYGSSIMANQANDNLYKNYLNTMATNSSNATTNRFGMQQQDNQYAAGFDKSLYDTKVNENQNLNSMNLQENLAQNNANFSQNQNYNNYNMANTQANNSYNLNKANWATNAAGQYNQLLAAPYEDQWRRATWDSSQNDRIFNRYNTFWQNADPLQDQKTQQEIASMAKQREGGGSSALGALGGIGGTILGGVVGSVVPGIGTALGAGLGGMLGGTTTTFINGAKPGVDWSLGSGSGVSGSDRVNANY
ncbi:hypothetical protein [Fundidesulfovibrio putealis]|uniref:hypothetical protein n=1 Tax=Fundidesulfovibrio putealis TaxID=270496 RepID=UPI0012EC0AD1|nr:hypothetical protein [Fundidesulfovibrio putealis]